MSVDLQWLILRNNSCFLMKRRNVPAFSKEPNNLKNKNSFRYSGLTQKQTLGVEPVADGKGVVLVTRHHKKERFPAKVHTRTELKKDARRTLRSIKRTIKSQRYRKDLKMAAVRRASAILRSQKPVAVKKVKPEKKKN